MQQTGKLSAKLVGIQVFFLAVALVSIGLTLLVSWRLEGSAAAINDAGSLRMRTYRLAYLAQEARPAGREPLASAALIRADVDAFEAVVATLRTGDPGAAAVRAAHRCNRRAVRRARPRVEGPAPGAGARRRRRRPRRGPVADRAVRRRRQCTGGHAGAGHRAGDVAAAHDPARAGGAGDHRRRGAHLSLVPVHHPAGAPAGGRPAADGEGRLRRPPAGRVEGRVRRAGQGFQPHGRGTGGVLPHAGAARRRQDAVARAAERAAGDPLRHDGAAQRAQHAGGPLPRVPAPAAARGGCGRRRGPPDVARRRDAAPLRRGRARAGVQRQGTLPRARRVRLRRGRGTQRERWSTC